MTESDLIEALNNDLANEYTAILQYINYAAKVSGPSRLELKGFFEAEIPDETGHAKFLSNKIVALGGEPTTTPNPVAKADTAREMLEAIVIAETASHTGYAERSAQAEALGLKGLQVQLEDMARDESEHRDEAKRILRRWDD